MFIIIIYSYNKLDRARCLQINITRVRLRTEKRRLEFSYFRYLNRVRYTPEFGSPSTLVAVKRISGN